MAAIDPLTAGAVLPATAATDAVYVMFTSAVVARKRVPAATWSSVWYLLRPTPSSATPRIGFTLPSPPSARGWAPMRRSPSCTARPAARRWEPRQVDCRHWADFVGWVERSDTHQCRAQCGDDGFRFALPILRRYDFAILATHCRPRFASSFALLEIRGRREDRVRAAPAVSRAIAQAKAHTSIQGSGSTPAFPAQWLYGLLRALPGERLFCLRRRAECFAPRT